MSPLYNITLEKYIDQPSDVSTVQYYIRKIHRPTIRCLHCRILDKYIDQPSDVSTVEYYTNT